ncbi:hypothetical protein MUK42_29207 [Musa troglodytarum]|uniref:Uncharacterized protein n=1 Tax=Musa troglodytarum TaxID=320322 RepID=A0A9E7FJP9_9LILI|nr:hypothetical protein MUK42_29207 [Musa troglodytarum]
MHPTRVARRLFRPLPSDSQPEKEFVALQKYAKREPGWLSSPLLRPIRSLPTTTRTITEVIADQEEDRPLHPGARIFRTPGPLPDPAPLCFAPLFVQNPNTEL